MIDRIENWIKGAVGQVVGAEHRDVHTNLFKHLRDFVADTHHVIGVVEDPGPQHAVTDRQQRPGEDHGQARPEIASEAFVEQHRKQQPQP